MKPGRDYHGQQPLGPAIAELKPWRAGTRGRAGAPAMLRALDGEVGGAASLNAVSEPLPPGPQSVGADKVSEALPDLALALLADNVGHLLVRRFDSGDVLRQFAAVFARISSMRGLVVDLRECRGCGSVNAWNLLAYLMNKPFNTVRCISSSPVLARRGPFAHGEDEVLSCAGVWSASVARPYDRPVAVLMGPASGAAAGDFAATFDAAGRGLVWADAAGLDTALFAAWRALLEAPGHTQAG